MTIKPSRYLSLAVALFALMGLGGCASYHAKPLSAQGNARSFAKHTLVSAGLHTFMQTQVGHPIVPWPPKAWTFNRLTLAALYYHPKLTLARAQWALARAKAVTAGAYPNPTLRLDPLPQYTSNAAAGLSPWTIGLTVDVPVLTAGKRSYRIAEARAGAEAARFGVVQTAWQIRADLRAPLIKLYGAQHRVKLLSAQVQDAAALLEALRQRYKAGQVSQYQVVQARIKWTNAQLSRADAETAQSQARMAVAGALGVTGSALDGVGLSFTALRRLPPAKTMPRARFKTWALTQRPDIRAALMRYAASEQALKLEIARQYPDLQIGPGYQWDQGAHRWTVGIALSLPAFNQNQGPIAQARAQRQKAGAEFRLLQQQITTHFDSALADYRDSDHKLELAQHLLKGSRARLASAHASYQAGETGRVALLRIRLETQSDRLALLKSRVQAMQALGALEATLEHPLHRAGAVSRAIQHVAEPGHGGSRNHSGHKSSP